MVRTFLIQFSAKSIFSILSQPWLFFLSLCHDYFSISFFALRSYFWVASHVLIFFSQPWLFLFFLSLSLSLSLCHDYFFISFCASLGSLQGSYILLSAMIIFSWPCKGKAGSDPMTEGGGRGVLIKVKMDNCIKASNDEMGGVKVFE